MHRIISTALVLAMLCIGSAPAAEPPKTQVLLVGTYHFSNPGKDLNNVKAVDVLAADRQREIVTLIACYGQGHIYLLAQCLREQPNVQLVDPLRYLAGTW